MGKRSTEPKVINGKRKIYSIEHAKDETIYNYDNRHNNGNGQHRVTNGFNDKSKLTYFSTPRLL